MANLDSMIKRQPIRIEVQSVTTSSHFIDLARVSESNLLRNRRLQVPFQKAALPPVAMPKNDVHTMYCGRAAEYAISGAWRVRRRQWRFANAALFSCPSRSDR